MAFNRYFVYTTKDLNIRKVGCNKVPAELFSNKYLEIYFSRVFESQVYRQIIRQIILKKQKNIIPLKLLKVNAHIFTPRLTKIISLSINTRVFLEKLKLAEVKTMNNKNSRLNINNHQPISLLSNI